MQQSPRSSPENSPRDSSAPKQRKAEVGLILLSRRDTAEILPNVYTACASLLGVPPIPRVDILADSRRAGVHKLTAPAAKAFSNIFEIYANHHGHLRARDLQVYMVHVYGQQHRYATLSNATAIVNRYSLSGSSSLRVQGFLSYIKDMTLVRERDVIRSLDVHDYRPDLTQKKLETREASQGGSAIGNHREREFEYQSPLFECTPELAVSEDVVKECSSLDFWQFGLYMNKTSTASLCSRCYAYNTPLRNNTDALGLKQVLPGVSAR